MDGLDTDHYHADFPSTDKGWTQLRPGGTPPCGRCSHTATLVGDLLYVVGGGRVPDPENSNEFEHFNDVHAAAADDVEEVADQRRRVRAPPARRRPAGP